MSTRVLCIGDTHCPAIQPGYTEWLVELYDQWDCNKVVHIGDVSNWNAISYHPKDPALPGPAEEYERAKAQIKTMQEAFPVVDVLVGNHDALPQRKARDVGLDPDIFIRDYKKIWETPRWTWHPRYTNLRIKGCPDTIFMHGDKGRGGISGLPAIKKAADLFCSVVCGHYHTSGGVEYLATDFKPPIFGLQCSTGADSTALELSYGVKFSRRPLVGCGVVIDGREAYYEVMPIRCKKQ